MINPLFIPNEYENNLIQIIQNYYRNEFALFRLTDTMYDKSIIDASQPIRGLFFENNIFDYYSPQLIRGEIYYLQGFIVSDIINEIKVSAYRPVTKKGDPRFWLYTLKRHASINDLIYITIVDSKIVAIPLNDKFDENIISNFFSQYSTSISDDTNIINELISKLRDVHKKGFIPSICTTKKNDKDVGETLELALGLPINNLVTADYKGEVEIKCKREGSSTDDTLFCKIPDWEISNEKSMRNIVTKYGYPDRQYDDCTSLFVTITTKPNPQGLFLDFDEENELLKLYHINGNDIASWKYSTLKKSLFEKHPKTAWIVAQEKKIDGAIHFMYKTLQITQNPIFSQFLSLIKQNIIVFEFRSSYYTSGAKIGKNKRDYGQAFRIDPKHRNQLFGDTQSIEL